MGLRPLKGYIGHLKGYIIPLKGLQVDTVPGGNRGGPGAGGGRADGKGYIGPFKRNIKEYTVLSAFIG